jgi:alanine racemase
MNITTVDISGIKNLKEGEQVEVIGAQHESKNSVQTIADTCGTITYDVLVHLAPSLVRRVQ